MLFLLQVSVYFCWWELESTHFSLRTYSSTTRLHIFQDPPKHLPSPQPNMGMFKNPVPYLYSGWVIGIPQYIGQCNSLTSAIQPLKIIQPAVTYQLHPITISQTLWLNSVKQPEHEASNPIQSYHNKINNRAWNTACLRQLLNVCFTGVFGMWSFSCAFFSPPQTSWAGSRRAKVHPGSVSWGSTWSMGFDRCLMGSNGTYNNSTTV